MSEAAEEAKKAASEEAFFASKTPNLSRLLIKLLLLFFTSPAAHKSTLHSILVMTHSNSASTPSFKDSAKLFLAFNGQNIARVHFYISSVISSKYRKSNKKYFKDYIKGTCIS